jgi:CDP-diglyceride synthetase
MTSTVVLITAISACLGFLLNGLVLTLVLSQGRKTYHYLFGAVLLICAIWDLGIFLIMVRNRFESELVLYGYVVLLPCLFLPALIYNFTCDYLNLNKKWVIILLWIICILSFIGIATGMAGRISGIIRYDWGNIYKIDPRLRVGTLAWIPLYIFALVASCLYFWDAYKRETSKVPRRHKLYILISFLALLVAGVKTLVLFEIDLPLLLPAGMLLNDIFAALIGIAIIKHQLFDVTVVIKKGAFYSLLAAAIIFVFSFSEHLLATFIGDLIGGHSTTIHLLSIAIVIAVLMPFKHRLEQAVEKYFAEKKIEF